MFESISDLHFKYNCDNEKVAKLFSVFYGKTESLDILKEHIITLEQNIYIKVCENVELLNQSVFNLSKIIEPKDNATARTYFEAYINTLFSLTDISALIFYQVFGLSTNPNRLYFYDLPKLSDFQQYTQTFNSVNSFLSSNDYKYFHNLNNHIKHRSMITAKHTINLGENRNLFSINEFEHNGIIYPSLDSENLYIKSDNFVDNLKTCLKSVE